MSWKNYRKDFDECQCFKVANSAFYKLPVKVTTIDHAVRMLGTREIASLCIACTAGKTLKAPANKATIDLSMFWQHSVATGVISKVLCNELGILTQNNIYLAGLIHDVGKIILIGLARHLQRDCEDYLQ